MTGEELPQCPVCGNDDVPADVYRHVTETHENEVAECKLCHSIIPVEALLEWEKRRKQNADETLDRIANLLRASADPFDEACTLINQLRIRNG